MVLGRGIWLKFATAISCTEEGSTLTNQVILKHSTKAKYSHLALSVRVKHLKDLFLQGRCVPHGDVRVGDRVPVGRVALFV